MEILSTVTLVVAAFITALSCFAESTRRAIIFLSIQAIAIGSVTLVRCLIDLIVGLNIEALIHFFIAFAEWFSAAVVVPLILYWGVVKTENAFDTPVIGVRRLAILVASTATLFIVLWIFQPQTSQGEMITLSFCMLMFSFSAFLMVTRRDSLKILVGLNMAENSLYPLLAEIPTMLVPLILALMIFVTAIGTYIVVEAYRDHGSLLVDRWRWLSE
ncbi:MAG: NADH-quinone oxidoreductase subunit K [Candidatus Bathyarchaeota archaeon]|nr:NADH-quinone oxidoreductase subunit K [Candidatus Bathyarchaeota archaeon]